MNDKIVTDSIILFSNIAITFDESLHTIREAWEDLYSKVKIWTFMDANSTRT